MKGRTTVFPPETIVILNLHLMFFICEIFIDLYIYSSKDSPSHSNFNIVNSHRFLSLLMPYVFTS